MIKYLLPLLLLTSAAIYLATDNQTVSTVSEDLQIFEIYTQWKLDQGRINNDSVEDLYRYSVFKTNYYLVQEENARVGKELLGLNNMADFSNEEYIERYLNQVKKNQSISNATECKQYATDDSFVPNTDGVDWRQKGGVTPVQDQGQCGSCWAFGTVGGLEGVYFVETGKLVKMSEQYLVDCAKNGNYGCQGGLEIYAYQYTQDNGIPTEASYPYFSGTTGKRGECKQVAASDMVFKNSGCFQLQENNPKQMIQAITNQTCSKGIAASSFVFQLYSGKTVMTDPKCGTNIDHSVTLVGYNDTDMEVPYWIIKNSWGPKWGASGYIMVEKTMDDVAGICAIQQDTTGATYTP